MAKKRHSFGKGTKHASEEARQVSGILDALLSSFFVSFSALLSFHAITRKPKSMDRKEGKMMVNKRQRCINGSEARRMYLTIETKGFQSIHEMRANRLIQILFICFKIAIQCLVDDNGLKSSFYGFCICHANDCQSTGKSNPNHYFSSNGSCRSSAAREA